MLQAAVRKFVLALSARALTCQTPFMDSWDSIGGASEGKSGGKVCRRDLGVIPERILGSGRECREGRRFFFLNLRQKSLLYGNIIPHNSFFEIINLKIFVDSCGISA